MKSPRLAAAEKPLKASRGLWIPALIMTHGAFHYLNVFLSIFGYLNPSFHHIPRFQPQLTVGDAWAGWHWLLVFPYLLFLGTLASETNSSPSSQAELTTPLHIMPTSVKVCIRGGLCIFVFTLSVAPGCPDMRRGRPCKLFEDRDETTFICVSQIRAQCQACWGISTCQWNYTETGHGPNHKHDRASVGLSTGSSSFLSTYLQFRNLHFTDMMRKGHLRRI